MINCLIVDDEQHSVDVLAHFAKQTDILHLVDAVTETSGIFTILNEQKIDLLFLDIHMPDLTGIDIVKALNGKCEVIFTTAYPQYAIEGFELGVADYLLKPVSYARFMKAVQKVAERIGKKEAPLAPDEKETSPDFIFVKTGLKNNVIKIVLNEIIYIESEGNYVNIYHGNQKTVVHISMNEMMQSLPEKDFVRVHRSYIIPHQRIYKIDSKWVSLKETEVKIPLSETYRASLWEIVNGRMIG